MCVYAEQCMQWCDRINEWLTDWLAGCICSKYMCIIILRSMYSKYVCLCSVHIHITTRPESMTHCSCFFLVHFIYFAIKFQCDLPITCTNCILKLIYCHNGMRDETLIQPIHCRSQRVGAAIAIVLFFRLRLPLLRLQCRPLRQRMVQILYFSAKRIVRILKTITCLVNTVEWQPLQIDPFCRKCMQILRKSQQSRNETENIYVLSLSLCISLLKYHFLRFETKERHETAGEMLKKYILLFK